MSETLSALVAVTAALDGLVIFLRLLGRLFSILRWGCSLYDVVDLLFDAARNPKLRGVIESVSGGKKFLAEMERCEGDAKKLAQSADMSRAEIMRLAYTCKIVWQERKKRALTLVQREREQRDAGL